jgi:hypothetical protein
MARLMEESWHLMLANVTRVPPARRHRIALSRAVNNVGQTQCEAVITCSNGCWGGGRGGDAAASAIELLIQWRSNKPKQFASDSSTIVGPHGSGLKESLTQLKQLGAKVAAARARVVAATVARISI